MDFLNYLIDTYNFPILSAFLLGIMTSLSPCPLATNITAIAFISKDLKSSKTSFLNGLFYTLGRGFSYTLVAILIYFGTSSFSISSRFQSFSDKFLGVILILVGLIMLDLIKFNFKKLNPRIETFKLFLVKQGYLGSFILGLIFALAFCPYSAVVFFGVLIPLILSSQSGLLLAPFFALGTGIPVLIFSYIIAFSFNKLSRIFNKLSQVEKVIRKIVAIIFILVGIYYLRFIF
jgi:cytochrome c biogenesis protein CcdA